ncbi:IF-2 domain-containing protein [Aphelenchoides besseyi]|nr:IF-2 domain-containing protein [Aphelenchoides besseyi]
MAIEKNVQIEQFNVIYRLVAALKEKLDQVYGPTIERKSNIYRFIRKGDIIYEGTIESLKHEEEFVSEAKINTEVGIALGDKSVRFKEDDQVEAYEEVTVERHVNWHPPGF